MQEQFAFSAPVLVQVQGCGNGKSADVLDISKCAVKISSKAHQEEGSAVDRTVIDLTESGVKLHGADAKVLPSISSEEVPSHGSVEADGNEELSSISQDSVAVEDSQSDTNSQQQPPYLYQNQLEDPDVAAIRDHDWFW